MSDVISRQDAIKTVCNAVCEDDVSHYPDCDQIKYCDEIQALISLPSTDAVKVVRCKDCYHAEEDITHMFCVYFHHKVYEDDYCSNAVERKENDET